MMLSTLAVDGFRNIGGARVELAQGANFFYGENGAGKTSLLEAVYYLILGRSFRTNLLKRLVEYQQDGLAIFARARGTDGDLELGVARSFTSGKQIKVGGKNISSHAEVASLFPVQLINYDSYLLLQGSSKIRRQFIDWGLFHVEPFFKDAWRGLTRALNQRNSALRLRASEKEITVWSHELQHYGLQVHNYRLAYLQELVLVAQEILEKLAIDFSITINYLPGWDDRLQLAEALSRSFNNDLYYGYTTVGPGRADLQILAAGVIAKDTLSRGQQKLLACGLLIAQAELLKRKNAKRCLFLVDDLAAELDLERCRLVARALVEAGDNQLVVTGLNREGLANIFAGIPINIRAAKLEQGKVFV